MTSNIPMHTAPEIWGPSFWFTLHNSALGYPEHPTNHVKERMKSFLHGLPIMLPCEKCYHHAIDYLETRKSDIDEIVSSRNSLFNFFVDFHNHVNRRNNKMLLTYTAAREMYINKQYRFSYE